METIIIAVSCFSIGIVSSLLFIKYFNGNRSNRNAFVEKISNLRWNDIEENKIEEFSVLRDLHSQTAFVTADEQRRGIPQHAVLLGVGPGDANLLTIGGLKVLQEAEIILSDRLVSEEIISLLKEINPEAELRMSRKCKDKKNADHAQDELNQWLLESMRQNKKVCRLKGGDPFVFGRGMEEVQILLENNFSVKVIPGVTSSFAAPLSAGISLTSRNKANKVMVATAHGQLDSFPDLPTFREDCTLVFLMGVSRLDLIMSELKEKGFSLDTPVAIVECATTRNQRTFKGTIATIADVSKDNTVKSPATIVVGRSCENDELPKGFETRYTHSGVLFSPKRNILFVEAF